MEFFFFERKNKHLTNYFLYIPVLFDSMLIRRCILILTESLIKILVSAVNWKTDVLVTIFTHFSAQQLSIPFKVHTWTLQLPI